jgi:ribose transport system permease protein
MRRLVRLLRNRDFTILLATGAVFLFFALANPRFHSADNLLGIVRQVSLPGIVAVGMTYLFVAGELDLSVGSNYGFLVTVVAWLIVWRGVNPWLAALAVIGLGISTGLVNGLLVTRAGIPSFIATMGSMAALRGAANLVSGGYPISASDTDSLFYKVAGGRVFGLIPDLTLWMLVVMLIGGVVLARTRFGFSVHATGGNVEAAMCNGIATRRVKLICFTLTGGLCGLIAALLFGWIAIAPYNTGNGFELQVIAAVVLGGTGLFGGRGTIFGTLVGALLLGMLNNGLILLGVRTFWDGVVSGVIIVIAAALDLVVRQSAEMQLFRRHAH